ncbi:MAG: DUF2189 domain-containing protein, partial [Gammaproteobacteria bacterium]|nr:DUF2189 domain-containing protein [Gammaproteobacteria bacterium]
PRQSLTSGVVIVALSYIVSLIGWWLGNLALVLALMSGFLLLGPALALGLYSISCRLGIGRTPTLGHCLAQGRRHLGNGLAFAVILLIVFLVWARAASMVHVFFPLEADPQWADLVTFLGVGSAVGAIFAGIVFAASAFALPMIMERKTDVVTAVVTRINAALRNGAAMAVGFATAFLGLAVLIPLIGHATWHAYRDTIDPSAWPADEAVAATR